MIEIQNLRDLTHEDVVNLLLEQKKQPFEIYVPKETQLYNSDREAISDDYAMLAYSGHLLSRVADKFEYEEVQPHDHDSVLFEIETKNIENLANTLLHISYGYVNDHPDDTDFSYISEASDYLFEVEEGIIKDIACPYFVELTKEFQAENEEE